MLLSSGNPIKCHEGVLSLQPTIPHKRFDIFPLTGGFSEGLDVFRFFFKAALHIIVSRSPCFAFCSPNYWRLRKCNKMWLNVWFNEMMRSRAAALVTFMAETAEMAEIEVSPQEERANPQGIKMFAVGRHGLPEDFVYFVLCVECNHRHLHFRQIGRLSGVRYSGRHRERLCASGLSSLELNVQVRRLNSCTTRIPTHMDASIRRTGRNG